MTRGLNRAGQSELCSPEVGAKIEPILNHLHRALDYFDTMETLKGNFPLLAARTIQGNVNHAMRFWKSHTTLRKLSIHLCPFHSSWNCHYPLKINI